MNPLYQIVNTSCLHEQLCRLPTEPAGQNTLFFEFLVYLKYEFSIFLVRSAQLQISISHIEARLPLPATLWCKHV